jgi:hypothetical protein
MPVDMSSLTRISVGVTRAHASVPYEGTMTRGEELRTACECREDQINGLTAE